MDVTQISPKEKRERAKKMMLWFGMASLIMGFAAWTSAYIVSSKREDWLQDFELPSAFFISTGIILLSSLTYILAKKAVRDGNQKVATQWLVMTLILGIGFVIAQFTGFSQIINRGYYFTGPASNITVSYIYLIATVHIAHVAVGIITLIVVLYNQIKGKYNANSMLGMDLGATFWHFIDLLWVYLLLFFYFYG